MSITSEIVGFLISFIEMFLLYRIYACLFYQYRKRETLRYELPFAIIGAGMIEVCSCFPVFYSFMIWLPILYMSFTAGFLYKINYMVLFSMSAFYKICMLWMDLLIGTIAINLYSGYAIAMETTSGVSLFRISITLGPKCLFLLLYLIFRKYLERISFELNYNRIFQITAIIGFFCYYYLIHQMMGEISYENSEFWILFAFFAGVVIFGFYFLFKRVQEKQKLDFFVMRNQLLEENYKTINDLYTKNARLYHDLNNHLNILYHLLDMEEVMEAKGYIKEISQPIMQLTKKVWTGVDVVDVILNSKLERAQEKGIEMDYHVEYPNNTDILAYDICTILSNLLDNAIEAVEKMDDRGTISLVIRKINHFLIIKISNPCLENNYDSVEFPATTKEDKHLHGWGLSSVKEAVEKYDGTIKYTNEKGKFTVTILLF